MSNGSKKAPSAASKAKRLRWSWESIRLTEAERKQALRSARQDKYQVNYRKAEGKVTVWEVWQRAEAALGRLDEDSSALDMLGNYDELAYVPKAPLPKNATAQQVAAALAEMFAEIRQEAEILEGQLQDMEVCLLEDLEAAA